MITHFLFGKRPFHSGFLLLESQSILTGTEALGTPFVSGQAPRKAWPYHLSNPLLLLSRLRAGPRRLADTAHRTIPHILPPGPKLLLPHGCRYAHSVWDVVFFADAPLLANDRSQSGLQQTPQGRGLKSTRVVPLPLDRQ